MKTVFLFIFLHGIVLNLFCQSEYLLLTRIKAPDRVKKIPEGRMVKIKTIYTYKETMKGRLDILNDSLISVGNDSIPVNEIRKITVRTKSTNIAGPLVTCAGIGLTKWGFNKLYSTTFNVAGPNNFIEFLGLVCGIVFSPGPIFIGYGSILTVAGIVIFLHGQDFKTYGKQAWSVKVAKDCDILSSGNLRIMQARGK